MEMKIGIGIEIGVEIRIEKRNGIEFPSHYKIEE